MYHRLVLCFAGLLSVFTALAQSAGTSLLDDIIQQHARREALGAWAGDPARYDVQVIYTQIDRDERNRPTLTSHRWGIAPGRYFYPASTVKMPAAFLALEKLNQLSVIGLDKHTAMHTGAGHAPQTPAEVDSSALSGLPSVGHYVRKIFLVSDNDAFNRLYEWLGQRALNEALRRKGFHDTRIIHRLSVSGFDTLGNRYTNPVAFYRHDTLLYQQGEVYSQFYSNLGLRDQLLGKGYIDANDQLVELPFDFRYKNYVSLQNLNDMLARVIFPEIWPLEQRFELSAHDYSFLYQAMAERPRESAYPAYPDKADNYVKFWMYADRDSSFRIPDHIRIYNKVGWAYGFLIDVAYVVDFEQGVEFMLTGAIHVNQDQIYNDGKYEYDEVGLPFFGQLGRAVYEYECARQRPRRPDLSRYRIASGRN